MFTHQAIPPHPLGLSVGATNLAGAAGAHSAAVRPSEVLLHGERLTGFVDRIGDPVPIVAPDGSHHRPEALLADALHTVAQAATRGVDATEVAVAVPAHWRPSVVDALRRTLQLEVVSDATSALTALDADPGLPRHGVVVLVDFGGSGTSITLADAGTNLAPIGDTVRFSDFSGDLVDQALLRHVAASFADTGSDPSGTAMVGSLTRLRSECRGAKERLSADTATTVVLDLSGRRADIRVTRAELEDLIRGPFMDFLAALDDTLLRRNIAPAAVSAVATIGGGARIPLVTQLLSDHLRVPVVTTPHPALIAANGAALLARRSGVVDTATALAPATGADAMTAAVDSGAPSSTFAALAWSQDDGSDDDVLFASADTDYPGGPSASRPALHFHHEQWQDSEPARRAPLMLFGLAAAAAVITTAGFGVTLLSDDTATPVEAATTVAPSQAPAAPVNTPAPPAPQAPLLTTVVVQPAKGPTPAPRHQAPAPRPAAPSTATPPPAAPPTTTPPTTHPPTTPPTTTDPTTPPSTPPSTAPETPPSPPEPPPIDPGPGNGEAPAAPADTPADLPPESEGGP